MPYLLLVSLIWAFSPGLISNRLVGLDSSFVTGVRLALALLLFLPFLRPRGLTLRQGSLLLSLGAVQFGLMYLAYNESFKHLASHEVALFTLTTPVFVTLLADLLDGTIHLRSLGAALLAVAGTAVIVFQDKALQPTLLGLALVQLSNLAFAIGQVGYKKFREKHGAVKDREVFALLYAGGVILAVAVMATRDISVDLNTGSLLTLLYLGLIASGLGFFLWNVGATRVSAGQLAVMNNAKIPLMVAVSLLVFREQADVLRLAVSMTLLVLAVWLADRQ
jgi:drug/metabolite transporter (DMT)-like permease